MPNMLTSTVTGHSVPAVRLHHGPDMVSGLASNLAKTSGATCRVSISSIFTPIVTPAYTLAEALASTLTVGTGKSTVGVWIIADHWPPSKEIPAVADASSLTLNDM